MSPPPNSVSHFGALHWPSTCVRSATRVRPEVYWARIQMHSGPNCLNPLYTAVSHFRFGLFMAVRLAKKKKKKTNNTLNRKVERLEFITL